MDYPGKVITKNQVTPTQTSATGVWTLDDAAAATRNNNWPVAGVPNPISKSLRFNSADSAYLNRTMAAAATSNTKTTFSCWVKRSKISTLQYLFASYENSNVAGGIYFTTGDIITIYLDMSAAGSDETTWTTTAVFRDVSAWYHVVVSIDVSQATNANKVLLYINGVSQTLTASQTGTIVTTQRLLANGASDTIGKYFNSSGYGDFYLTEYNVIDGQQLTPSSFGMTDPITGVWEPLKYSGTYGTNGFYLNFKDATSTTTLGLDYSGNSNTWTTNNFSVTAGAGNDSLTDVPTPWIVYNTTGDVGGVVRGNYCTLNPLNKAPSNVVLSNGNLEASSSFTSDHRCFAATFQVTSGKWYWEVQYATGTISAGSNIVGIFNLPTPDTANNRRPADSVNNGIGIRQDGQSESDNNLAAYFGSSIAVADIIGIKLDADAGTVAFNVNGGSFGSTLTFVSAGGVYTPGGDIRASSGTPITIHNFGQRPFAYTPPSGFLSLCTTNLPASTVLKGSEYMNAVLYTGTGSPLSVTGVGFKPDWVWAKKRSATDDHVTSDALRGVQKDLTPNSTAAEATNTNGLQSFDSDGFSIGSGSGSGVWGGNSGATYVAWNWKASNAAGVTNTAGSITSTVSANTTSGFSIVTYTGTGANATVGHGLGVAPSMVIVKNRTDGTRDWLVYHSSIGNTAAVFLNLTSASVALSAYWNNTSPTSSVFSLGNSSAGNGSTNNLVAYCFAPISGFSAFGSYTGNGSADGPFVYTGFRPRWVMLKKTSATDDWVVFDTARDTFNVVNDWLFPNLSNAELTSAGSPDVLSNGFKLRSTSGATNASGATFIYAAFAENPFKNALAR
jgi:hypothetical protein